MGGRLEEKGHEDLHSGLEKREQGEGVFFCGSFSGEKRNEACWGARPQLLKKPETYTHKCPLIKTECEKTALLIDRTRTPAVRRNRTKCTLCYLPHQRLSGSCALNTLWPPPPIADDLNREKLTDPIKLHLSANWKKDLEPDNAFLPPKKEKKSNTWTCGA